MAYKTKYCYTFKYTKADLWDLHALQLFLMSPPPSRCRLAHQYRQTAQCVSWAPHCRYLHSLWRERKIIKVKRFSYQSWSLISPCFLWSCNTAWEPKKNKWMWNILSIDWRNCIRVILWKPNTINWGVLAIPTSWLQVCHPAKRTHLQNGVFAGDFKWPRRATDYIEGDSYPCRLDQVKLLGCLLFCLSKCLREHLKGPFWIRMSKKCIKANNLILFGMKSRDLSNNCKLIDCSMCQTLNSYVYSMRLINAWYYWVVIKHGNRISHDIPYFLLLYIVIF